MSLELKADTTGQVYTAAYSFPNGTGVTLYNTLATINVTTSLPSGSILSATRNVTKLFYVSGQLILYITRHLLPTAQQPDYVRQFRYLQ